MTTRATATTTTATLLIIALLATSFIKCTTALERTIQLEDGSERMIEYIHMDLPLVNLPRAQEGGRYYTASRRTMIPPIEIDDGLVQKLNGVAESKSKSTTKLEANVAMEQNVVISTDTDTDTDTVDLIEAVSNDTEEATIEKDQEETVVVAAAESSSSSHDIVKNDDDEVEIIEGTDVDIQEIDDRGMDYSYSYSGEPVEASVPEGEIVDDGVDVNVDEYNVEEATVTDGIISSAAELDDQSVIEPPENETETETEPANANREGAAEILGNLMNVVDADKPSVDINVNDNDPLITVFDDVDEEEEPEIIAALEESLLFDEDLGQATTVEDIVTAEEHGDATIEVDEAHSTGHNSEQLSKDTDNDQEKSDLNETDEGILNKEEQEDTTKAQEVVQPQDGDIDASLFSAKEDAIGNEDDDSKPNENDVFPNNLYLNPRARTSPLFDDNANQGFVEGLDDFGKFMESVDPPDELDVGASGSSIQEVLMQQGTRIVIKRIQMGVGKVRRAVSAVRRGVREKISSVATNQKEHIDFALVVVDKTQQQVSRITKTLQEIYDRVLFELKARFDIDFTSSDDDDEDDDDFQFHDMKSMFQQQQRSTGGATQSGGQIIGGGGDNELRFSNDGARSIEELRALIQQQKEKSMPEEAINE